MWTASMSLAPSIMGYDYNKFLFNGAAPSISPHSIQALTSHNYDEIKINDQS